MIKYQHKVVGGNFRLDAIQAAAVLAKLKYLEGWSETRRKIADRYRKLFDESNAGKYIRVPREIFPRHIYNQFVIRVEKRRDALKEFLKTRGVSTEIYYPLPLHVQECFSNLGYKEGDFPKSEKASKETLALPVSHEITADQQAIVVSAISEFFS